MIISAAGLCFEINLTRLYSVSHFYHFAFMVISLALLGFGASGTFLAVFRRDQKATGGLLALLAAGTGASMLGSYLLINHVPFDSFSMMVDRKQILILMLHYAALATPFFFNGMIVSFLLSQEAQSSGGVYAINLLGSALGCLAAVIAPNFLGGEGTAVLSCGMAGLAAAAFIFGDRRDANRKRTEILFRIMATIALITIPAIDLTRRVMTSSGLEVFELHISPYKGLSYAVQNPEARIISSKWNSISRVDIVESPSLHSIPGLSYRFMEPLPSMRGTYVDGDNMNAILSADAGMDFAGHLPAAIAFNLRQGAKTMILESRGAANVLTAKELGAGEITAVEENPLLIEAAKDIYTMPDVELVISSSRSYMRTTKQLFDIIQLPLTSSYHPVSSGAYSLGEDYQFTLESFNDMLGRLDENGILVVTRWLQEKPSEWLRTIMLAVSSLESMGVSPSDRIVALRGYNTGTLLVKNSEFTDNELTQIRTFIDEKAFDIVFSKDIQPEEINQNNILPEEVYYRTFTNAVDNDHREGFYRDYVYDVRPPTDDQPFFGHYFKWSQIGEIWRSLGTTWQPFGGAGFLVILAIFGLASILAGGLIALPAFVSLSNTERIDRRKVMMLTYFGMIGLAFMLVEMPMIQQSILYLDHPTYAMAVVLFSLLLFSGAGSRWGSKTLPLPKTILILLIVLVIWMLLVPVLINSTMGLSLPIRIIISVVSTAPIGFLMGIPFPAGLDWMRKHHQYNGNAQQKRMTAWIWAVNGSTSVIATILSSLLALSFGFKWTFGAGMICYLIAWIMVSVSEQRSRLPPQ